MPSSPGLWIVLGVGQGLAGLCALLGCEMRRVAFLLAVLAAPIMLIPKAVILGATPLVAFGCAMLGWASALLMKAGAAQDGQPGLWKGKSG